MKPTRRSTVLVFLVILGITSCMQEQPTKQYYDESPEIEIAKKVIDAFEQGDLKAYRSLFSDTAKLWHNESYVLNPGKTIDEQMVMLESYFTSSEYRIYENEIWEMIIQDEGANWVHFWADFRTKLNGDETEVKNVIHLAFSIYDNKVVYEAGIWDNLPFFLAQQRLEMIEE